MSISISPVSGSLFQTHYWISLNFPWPCVSSVRHQSFLSTGRAQSLLQKHPKCVHVLVSESRQARNLRPFLFYCIIIDVWSVTDWQGKTLCVNGKRWSSHIFAFRAGSLPRLLCPWNFPGKDTGMGCHFLLQGIFPTQGLNLCLLHCKRIYRWATMEEHLACKEAENWTHWLESL